MITVSCFPLKQSPDLSYEYIDVHDENGFLLATQLGNVGGNQYVEPIHEDLPISQSQLAAWASDGEMSFTVIPHSGVHDLQSSPNEYVSGTLTYPVPEPATLWLLAVSGLVFFRRRRCRA